MNADEYEPYPDTQEVCHQGGLIVDPFWQLRQSRTGRLYLATPDQIDRIDSEDERTP